VPIPEGSDALTLLQELLARYRLVETPGLPRFCGGAVGFLSYDMVRYFERLPDELFTQMSFTDPEHQEHSYQLADTTVSVPLPRGAAAVTLRQITRRTPEGTQIPLLTSRTDLPAAELIESSARHDVLLSGTSAVFGVVRNGTGPVAAGLTWTSLSPPARR